MKFEDQVESETLESEDFSEKPEEQEGVVSFNIEDIGIEQKVVTYVRGRFDRAKDARWADEARWLKSYRNYRGVYPPELEEREDFDENRSKVFIKITKTKVLAATAQINEVLFGGNKFPISVEPTIVPTGISEAVHMYPNQPTQAISPSTGSESEDSALRPGETYEQYQIRLGGIERKLKPVAGELKEGPGTTPDSVTFHPAAYSAKKMEKRIHDQLEESDASKELRYGSFECALFGTMIMKGPFAINKEYPKWSEEGDYTPVFETVPQTSYVPIWNFYPDPDGKDIRDAEHAIERHKLSRSQLRTLKRRPHFNSRAIDDAIEIGENYIEEWWEHQITDKSPDPSIERFQVLEFWGFVDADLVKDFGVRIPKELSGMDQLSANIWICNDQVLRFVLNPFKPAYLPYYAVPYEINPYSFFGIGIAENMEDTQALMNVFMRMSVDNAALSGNNIFEIDEDALAPGENLELFPGKVFRRQKGAVGQAITGISIPNVAAQNMQLFDVARRLSDEATGMPSFAHGQTGVTGVGRTASGISMLMSAANGNIRQVVKNVDDYLLGPLGKAFFHFNMQFNHDPEIKGDLEVKARGTESLMANEVKSQRYMQFLQVILSHPATLAFGKLDYIIGAIAKSLDLDPEKSVNSLADAAVQAKMLGAFAQQMPQGEGAAPGGPPNASDTSGAGGGNMGVGSVPNPEEQGFSGA